MKKIEFFLLSLILILGFVVRLYRFDGPIADWHSWRQADTSAVSRNFIKYGFDLLHPRFDDLSNVASRQDNPQGYRFVEFPIYNTFQAGLFKYLGVFTLEEWGRLVTIFSSLLSSLFLYLLVKKYAGMLSGLLSAFFFTFLPFNIYFGRTILPDTSMLMAILGGIYFFDRWIEERLKPELKIKNYLFLFLSIVFTAAAFLLKPYALFFTLPMFYLAIVNFRFRLFLKWELFAFIILALAPLVFWRVWMQQYPEGIPGSAWLFNKGDVRFKGAFFRWLFADRMGRLILGYWGLPLFVFGFLSKIKNSKISYGFFLSFLLSSLLYMFVVARGNVQHDYYQILIVPSLVIYMALGSSFLLKVSNDAFSKVSSYLVFAVCTIFMFTFSWYFVRDFFNINNPSIVKAGEVVDRILPKDAKIIANYEGDTSFLYQTKRRGWASFEKSLPEMKEMGAGYLVLVNPTEGDYGWGKTYKIVASDKSYLIFDLSQKP